MPLSRNLGTLTSWNRLGPSGPVMGLLYIFNKISSLLNKKCSFYHVAEHGSCITEKAWQLVGWYVTAVMPRDAKRGITFVVIPYFSVCIPYFMSKILLDYSTYVYKVLHNITRALSFRIITVYVWFVTPPNDLHVVQVGLCSAMMNVAHLLDETLSKQLSLQCLRSK